MKFKIPSKIEICGAMWKIKQEKNHSYGSFSFTHNVIEIGMKNPAVVENILLHEIVEVIMSERKHRYTYYGSGNEKMMFAMDHAQFEDFCDDLLSVLRKII